MVVRLNFGLADAMGFFDEASSLFNRGVVNAGRSTRSLAIKAQLNELKKQREGLCRQLGAGLYEQARHMPELREPLEALFVSIEALDTQSAALQHELDDIEERARLAQAASVRRCPSCGTPLGPDDQFCVGCGMRAVPPAPVSMPTPVTTSFCRSCGAALAESERFCVSCGQPVAQPPAVEGVEEPAAGDGLGAQESAPIDESAPRDEPAAADGPELSDEPTAADEPVSCDELAVVDEPVPRDEPTAADESVLEPTASEPAAPSGSTAPLPPVPPAPAEPTVPLPPAPAASTVPLPPMSPAPVASPAPIPPVSADATQALYVRVPGAAPSAAPIGQRAAICGNCGYENVSDAIFCRNCGHRI